MKRQELNSFISFVQLVSDKLRSQPSLMSDVRYLSYVSIHHGMFVNLKQRRSLVKSRMQKKKKSNVQQNNTLFHICYWKLYDMILQKSLHFMTNFSRIWFSFYSVSMRYFVILGYKAVLYEGQSYLTAVKAMVFL